MLGIPDVGTLELMMNLAKSLRNWNLVKHVIE